MGENLILVGGGGHCKSVISAAESAGYIIKGILDVPENVGNKVLDYNVIGTDDDIAKYIENYLFVVTVGQIEDCNLRIILHNKITAVGGKLATVVASTACVSRYATLGEGSVVLHQAVINADVRIGKGCIINTLANIEHDVIVGEYSHISTGAMVNGNCRIGNRVFVGSGSVLINNVTVSDDSVIGAGTVVNKNIEERGVYAGNPVRKIK